MHGIMLCPGITLTLATPLKANRLLGLIKRTFSYLESQMLRLLYITLIRPHLDYACVVWNPYQLGDIRALEQVQRRVTRTCPTLSIFHIMIDLWH